MKFLQCVLLNIPFLRNVWRGVERILNFQKFLPIEPILRHLTHKTTYVQTPFIWIQIDEDFKTLNILI